MANATDNTATTPTTGAELINLQARVDQSKSDLLMARLEMQMARGELRERLELTQGDSDLINDMLNDLTLEVLNSTVGTAEDRLALLIDRLTQMAATGWLEHGDLELIRPE
ncbi:MULTISPECIES: hypothetical protein [unclassified Synechococcus]|uniref:hypothetical protein n=1 Tax=unclassified Synechococcus TaxID=2626047 RepID=UPI0039AEC802